MTSVSTLTTPPQVNAIPTVPSTLEEFLAQQDVLHCRSGLIEQGLNSSLQKYTQVGPVWRPGEVTPRTDEDMSNALIDGELLLYFKHQSL